MIIYRQHLYILGSPTTIFLFCSILSLRTGILSSQPRNNWKGHQTFPLCSTYKQRIVSWYYVFYISFCQCVSLKRSIIGKPVQFHGSIQIPQSNIHRKAPAVRGNTPSRTRIPVKSQLSGICNGKWTTVFIIVLLITTYGNDTLPLPM